jgi:predicted RNA-binding protein with TRAM domain
VEAGQEYDVKIESMSRRGDSGVARIQGLVVFVSGARTGDQVRIKITKIGSGFATAEVADSIDSLAPEAEAETSGDSDE